MNEAALLKSLSRYRAVKKNSVITAMCAAPEKAWSFTELASVTELPRTTIYNTLKDNPECFRPMSGHRYMLHDRLRPLAPKIAAMDLTSEAPRPKFSERRKPPQRHSVRKNW